MRKRPDAAYWIEKLQLTRHVEGGAFREIYRSELVIPRHSLPLFFQGDRSASTHIYFLLADGEFSAFHRIAADELWHFYSGDPLLVHEITHSGRLVTHRLASDPGNEGSFFAVIRGGSWFASNLAAAVSMRWSVVPWRRVLTLQISSWRMALRWQPGTRSMRR